MLKWVGECCKRELRRYLDRLVLALVVVAIFLPFIAILSIFESSTEHLKPQPALDSGR